MSMHTGLSLISTELARSRPAPCPPGWQMAREMRAMWHVGRDLVRGTGQAGGVANEGARQPVADSPAEGPA
eukprot:5102249-Alexandrium_andersonii.AAC.1